jgi:hypothetical protein
MLQNLAFKTTHYLFCTLTWIATQKFQKKKTRGASRGTPRGSVLGGVTFVNDQCDQALEHILMILLIISSQMVAACGVHAVAPTDLTDPARNVRMIVGDILAGFISSRSNVASFACSFFTYVSYIYY